MSCGRRAGSGFFELSRVFAALTLATLIAGCSQRGFQGAKVPASALALDNDALVAKSTAGSQTTHERHSHGEIDHSQQGCCDTDHESAPETFHVRGLVANPGRYALPKNTELHLLDAVAIAGGVSTVWADKAHIIRQAPGGKTVTIPVSIKQAREAGKGNLRLNPGDVVSVDPTLATTFITDIPSAITDSVGRAMDLFQ